MGWGGPAAGPACRSEGRDSAQTKDPRQIYGPRSWRRDETWNGEDPGRPPRGTRLHRPRTRLTSVIGRGVTRTGQLLPIQVWSTRASVRSGRVATPGPADDTYPTPSRQFWGRLGVIRHRGWSPGSRERLPAAASRVTEYQTGPAGATVAPTRIHPGTPGGSRLAGGNQAQVPGGGGPAVRNLESRVRAERQVGLGQWKWALRPVWHMRAAAGTQGPRCEESGIR